MTKSRRLLNYRSSPPRSHSTSTSSDGGGGSGGSGVCTSLGGGYHQYHNQPTTHLFTEWYLFVLSPIFIMVSMAAFIHYSTVASSLDAHNVIVTPYEESLITSAKTSLFEDYMFDYKAELAKRELNMKKYSYRYKKDGVDKRTDLSLQEFYDVYDAKWPVIVKDVLPTWPAYNWSREFFKENYGKERVAMKAVNGPLESASSLALPLELFYKNSHQASKQMWTYLEDELFIPLRPQLYQDILGSIYTEGDLFREFPSEVRPWDAMLLWGTQYSRSSLHIDPYNWTGTNAVIFGKKRWKLFPPTQDHLLHVTRGVKSGFPLNCYKYNSVVDSFSDDEVAEEMLDETRFLQFDQLPGEILFIPTGWYHQAYNMKETLAVSGQVMNENNYRIVLEELFKAETVQRTKLPVDVDYRTVKEQVAAVMNTLSEEQLAQGRAVTENIIDQVKNKRDRVEL